MIHEQAHLLFCRLTRTRVVEVCYFRWGNPAGYVRHLRPSSVWKHMLIGTGPFLWNSVVALTVGCLAVVWRARDVGAVWWLGAFWLAFAVGAHAFPSTGDARSIWSEVWSDHSSVFEKLVGAPLVGLIYLGSWGSRYAVDWLYAVLVAVVVPLELTPRLLAITVNS